MSRNVEENVVKMTFDNKDFDNNIKQSEESVSGFQKSLTSLKDEVFKLPTSMVSGLNKVLSNIDLKDVLGIGAIIAGVELAKNSISSIGYTLESVASNAIGIVSSTMYQIINQIEQGGKARALNIQQAKFQIEGLGMDVETFMEAANYAVADTAYGLDSAAKAAAQLGASGVTSLEKLKYSLRGISGVASMTNSSYEDIAHIFTTIAGMGKVTNQYLDSIAIKGLNARAKLGEQLGKTEAEVRDMVAKGQVDFDTFAKAMDNAFGEHAKEANKTFTGVMSNINAALSKIGEGFYTPLLSDTLLFLDQIRAVLNQIKKEMANVGIFDAFGKVVKDVSGSLEKMFKNISYAIEKSHLFEDIGKSASDIFGVIDKVLKSFINDNYAGAFIQIFNAIGDVLNKVRGILFSIVNAFDEVFGLESVGHEFLSLLLWVFNTISDSFNGKEFGELQDVFVSWFTALKEVYTTIMDILGINRKNIAKIFGDAVTTVYDFFKGLKVSDDEIDKLKRTASGLASIIDMIKMFVVELFKFIKPAFGLIGPGIDLILSGTAKIGDFFTNLRNDIKTYDTIPFIFDKLGNALGFVINLIKDIKNLNFMEAFFGEGSSDVSFFSKVITFISGMFKTISEHVKKIDWAGIDLSPITNLFSGLSNFGNGVTGDGTSLIDKVISAVTFIKDFIVSLFDSLKGIFQGPVRQDINTMQREVGTEGAPGYLDIVKAIISWAITEIIRFAQGIATALNSLGPGIIVIAAASIPILSKLIDAMVEITKIIAKSITTITIVAAVLIAFSIAANSVKNVINNFVKDITFFGHLSKVMSTVSRFFKMHLKETKIENRDKISDIIKSFADFMWSITGSLILLSMVPVDDLKKAIVSIGIMLGMVSALIAILALISSAWVNLGSKTKVISSLNGKINLKSLFNKQNGIKLGGGKEGKIFSNDYELQSSPLGMFAALIQAITVGLLEISIALKVVSSIDSAALSNGVLQLSVMLTVITAVVVVISAFLHDNVFGKGDILAAAASIALVTAAIVMISSSMAILTNNIKNNESLGRFAAIGGIIMGFLALIGLIVGLMANFGGKPENMLASVLALTSVIFMMSSMLDSVRKLIKEIKSIGTAEEVKIYQDFMVAIFECIGVIAGAMAIVGALAGLIPEYGGTLALLSTAVVELGLAVTVLAFGIAVKPALDTVKALAVLMYSWNQIMLTLKDMKDEDVDKWAGKVAKMIFVIFTAFSKDEKLKNDTKNGIEDFLTFLGETIVPAMAKFTTKILPKIIGYLVAFIGEIYVAMESLDQNIIANLLLWLGTLIYPAVEAIMEVLGNIIDTVTMNSPRLIEKVAILVLAIMALINYQLDTHKDEIAKNITYIVSFLISVATLAILAEDNLKKIYVAGMAIVSMLMQGVAKFAVPLAELFSNLAKYAIAAFMMEFASAGLFDSDSWLRAMFDKDFDKTFNIDFNVDTSNITDKYNEMNKMFSNSSYDFTGVYASNSAAIAKGRMQGINMQEFKDQLIEGLNLEGLMDNIKLNTNVKLEFEPNAYGMMNILDQETSLQDAGGWTYAY